MTRRQAQDEKNVDELTVEMLRSVAAVSNDIMLVIDREGRYHDVYAGPAVGIPASGVDLVGQNVRDVFPPDVAIQILSVIEDVLHTGEQQALDYPMQEGAVTRWFSGRATPLDGPGPPRVVWCARDVTSVKQLEENRADIDQRLRQIQRLQALGTLAAGVAHDFNNILTAIVGYTELVRASVKGDDDVTSAVEGILAASQQATELTRSLLTFGRRAGTQKSVFDFGRVVQDSVRVLHRLLPASVELEAEVAPRDAVWVHADAAQIQQVVVNLALNAHEAMSDGGRVTLRVRGEDDTFGGTAGVAILEIEDTGRGIGEDERDKIFEPFYTTKPREPGTGLGLTVAHAIVTEHEGTIEVESRVGSGTRVVVRLPRRAGPDMVRPPRHSAASGTGEMVLLAEDNEPVRSVMATTLKAAGYQVVPAADGVTAMETIRSLGDRLRLLVLDIELPRRNGLDCLREIRRDRPDLPVVMITGAEPPEDLLSGDGAIRLLRKPFRVSEFTDLVGELLS